MKNLALLLFSVIFMFGLLIQSDKLQAQDASDKEMVTEYVRAYYSRLMSDIRMFGTPSGKEQFKVEGEMELYSWEIVVNVNAVGKMGRRINCIANGTIYFMGEPWKYAHNKADYSLAEWQDWLLPNDLLVIDMGPWQFCN